ncbi:MAG: leucine-rich repeat protein, partial [Flavobacteriaceae bacterium]|nr:leucine-rich repeat protein [Flavobacteriaceae bacterium]
MKQKLLFIYLNILFLLCMSFKVQAQEYTLTDDDVVVENGMIKSCSYDFSMRDIIIPETLDGQTVIAIFNDVFKFKEITSVVLPNTLQSIMRGVFSSNKLESVVIPNSVKKIGRYAFSSNLITNITLPEGITSIPDWMCSYNELVNITIPSSVTTIGRYAFLGNNLISLELQDGLKYIKNNAFMNNKLSSIVLPTTINEIGLDAFSGNPYLTSLILPASVSESWDFINWTDNNGIVYLVNSEVSDFEKGYTANWGYTLKDDDVVVLNGVITSCNYNFAANNITIPDILDGQEIVGIGSTIPGVFAKKNIREIIFPKGLISIGSDSFSNNKLTTVVLPNSVVSIGKHAFYGYNGLSSIQLPTPQIEGSGFLYWIDGKGINWTPGAIVSDYMISYKAVFIYTLTDDDVVVVNGVIESCSYSFKENSIIIPDILDGQEITGIGERVFSAKNIVEITLPNTLIEIGNGAFSNNKIIRSVLPQNLEIIADSAFSNNNIASLDIPISVTSIGKSAFNNSSIRSLKIPSSIVKIEDGCFMGNYDLSEVVFPEGLIEIGEKAFLACYGLSEVTLPSTVTFIGKRAFDLIGSLKSFTLPSPEKTGYTLVHWLDGNNVIHEVGAATSNKSPSYTAVFEINNYLISGIVTGADAVELTLSGDVNETISVNNGGTYEFSVEYYKSVKLVAKKRGYRFETGEYDFPNLWGDKVAVNFIATENPNLFPPTIGERVFSLDENTSAGITLGTIILQDKDIPADEDILFSILDNTGVFSIDPVSGTIIANENSNFNFETTSTVQITVIVNDYKHPDVSKIFTIQINDVNEFPSDIFISTKIINDNVAVGDELATLTTEDVDANQTFTYTIAENPYFKIVSDKLYLKSPLNCNQDPIIAVLITVEDQGGLSFEKEITITVKDVTGPVLPLFPNIVDECSVTVTPPVVVDVCAGEITGTTTDSLFYDVQGNYVINWTFKDGNDNITSQTQNVIIDDVTGPFKNSDTIISTQNYGTEVLFMGQRFVSNMVVVDGIMYTTSWRGENLSSFDLKKPEESFVVLAGGYGELWGITSKDKEIYFSSDQGVIRKYHIETQEVTIVASGLGPLRGIVIKDDYLYFSTTNGFVKRINLLNPASPAEIVVQGLGWLMGIQLNGNQLYIAGNDNAVYTIDINNQLPIVPEVFVTINNAYNIYIVGEEILISSFGGIHVVKENKEIIQLSNRSGVRAIIVFEGDFYFSDFNTGIYKISFDPIYAPIIVEDLNFQCEITQADLTSPVFEDNCAGEITGTTNFDFSKTQEEGTYEITWTFKDGNKNITTQTQQVIIKDTTKPVVDLD